MDKKQPVFNIPESVKIVFFIENGVQCWSLDEDDIEMCMRRGYPFKVVKYGTDVQ